MMQDILADSEQVDNNKYLYRFDDVHGESGTSVFMTRYAVTKETEASYRISYPPHHKWILKGIGKRFAHDTIEGAMHSYLARKTRQIRIHAARLEIAKEAKLVAEHLDLSKVECYKYYTEFDGATKMLGFEGK